MRRFFKRFNLYVTPTAPAKTKLKSFSQTYVVKKKAQAPKKRTTAKKKKDWSVARSNWNKLWESGGYKGFWESKQKEIDNHNFNIWKKNKLRQNFNNFRKDIARQKFGMGPKKNFAGGNTASFRTYKNYGPMKSLGPKLLFELIPTPTFMGMWVKMAKEDKTQLERIRRETENAIKRVRKGIIIYGMEIIGKYVPKDTGDLRKSLIDSLRKSNTHGLQLKMSLDTGNIQYANVVNNMPDRMLRHPHPGGRLGLNDPKAQKGWFQFIDMLLNTRARKLFKVFIEELYIIWARKVVDPNAPAVMRGVRRPQSGVMRQKVETPTIVSTPMVDVLIRDGTMTTYPSDNPDIDKERTAATGQRFIYRHGPTQDPTEEDRQKHIRYGHLRENRATREKMSHVVYQPKTLIRKMFKLKGVNKR